MKYKGKQRLKQRLNPKTEQRQLLYAPRILSSNLRVHQPPKQVITIKTLIEKEEIRRRYFISIRKWVRTRGIAIGKSQGCMDSILSRFILANRITQRNECCQDSIFFSFGCKQCDRKEGLPTRTYKLPQAILRGLCKRIHKAQQKLRMIKTTLEPKESSSRDLMKVLNIRYNYFFPMRLSICRPYAAMQWKRDEATEGFATSRDHYFHYYCSPWVDLEKPLGSLGSFFDQTWDSWPTKVIHVNPPFDRSIFPLTLNKIEEWLNRIRRNRQRQLNFIMVVPNWPDWPFLDYLKNDCEWVRHSSFIEKDKAWFINSHSQREEYLLDIWEFTLAEG